jgi:hypothetical protein
LSIGTPMYEKQKNPELMEKVGRFFLFRAAVYLLPILYSVRLILMVFTPRAYQMPVWKMVLWQAIRDALVVLNLILLAAMFCELHRQARVLGSSSQGRLGIVLVRNSLLEPRVARTS